MEAQRNSGERARACGGLARSGAFRRASWARKRGRFVAGGLFSSLMPAGFGTASMVVGYQGRDDVGDALRQENIVAPKDSRIPGQFVDTGSKARAQTDIIREHQLKTSEGLTTAGRSATPFV